MSVSKSLIYSIAKTKIKTCVSSLISLHKNHSHWLSADREDCSNIYILAETCVCLVGKIFHIQSFPRLFFCAAKKACLRIYLKILKMFQISFVFRSENQVELSDKKHEIKVSVTEFFLLFAGVGWRRCTTPPVWLLGYWTCTRTGPPRGTWHTASYPGQ